MKRSLIVLVAVLCAVPLVADNIKMDDAPLGVAVVDGKAESDAPVPEQEADKSETAMSTEELAGKLESLGEAMTEARNSLENLNRLKLSGYIQAQYVNDERSANELSGAGTKNFDQFSIRRGRVKFTYQFGPTSRFVIQPDITTNGVVLKDGYVELTEPWTSWKHTITAGQFNWPFGFEVGYSSSMREVAERSRVIRTLFPGERDRGVMLSGLGFNDRFSYRLAVVNGNGTTQTFDANKRKDVVGRLGYSFGALDLGASIYRGSDLVATATNAKGHEFAKDRLGVDFQWATPIQGLGLRGEYISGKQAPIAGTTRTESQDVNGWYFYAIQNIGVRHQLVVRVDQYDPDTNVANNAIRTINPSYIFHWDGNSKWMLSYEIAKNQIADPQDNLLTIRYQYSF